MRNLLGVLKLSLIFVLASSFAYGQWTFPDSAAAIHVCANTTASGTAQSCNTTPLFTPVAGSSIIFTTNTANTGASLTLNVNSLGAKPVAKWQSSTTLAAGDVSVGAQILATYDGFNWEISTIANAPSGSISGLTSGYLPLAGSASSLTANAHINDGVTTASTLTATETFTFNAAGAASTATAMFTGLPFAGTGTTSVPGVYINQGAAPTTWTVATTEFGINAATGFVGNFVDYHVDGGASVYSVNSAGSVTAAGTGTFGQIHYGGTINVTGCSLTNLTGTAYAGVFASGTTGTCTVTITPGPTAAHGFFCRANNIAQPANAMLQTAYSATTATMVGLTTTGDAIAFSCDPNNF